MSRARQALKRKRRSKVVPVLGAAGLSLSLAGGASAATGAPVTDAVTHNGVVSHEITPGQEEIADVSLATFYVFDKENAGPSRHGVRLACGCWTGIIGRHLVRSGPRTRRSTFGKAGSKHDQAQPPQHRR